MTKKIYILTGIAVFLIIGGFLAYTTGISLAATQEQSNSVRASPGYYPGADSETKKISVTVPENSRINYIRISGTATAHGATDYCGKQKASVTLPGYFSLSAQVIGGNEWSVTNQQSDFKKIQINEFIDSSKTYTVTLFAKVDWWDNCMNNRDYAEAEATLIVDYDKDSDADGIIDSEDECPNQGEGELGLDSDGCPLKDSDGDGIADRNDECPEQGASEIGLTSDGCPAQDSDNDGLTNRVDVCPDSYGTKSNGCPTFLDKIVNILVSIGLPLR